MNEQLLQLLILSSCFLALFILAEFIHLKFKVKTEYTRKIVHAGTGILALLFPFKFSSHWYVLLICSLFMVLLLLSLKYNFFKGINDVGRFTLGSLLYPVAVYVSFLFYEFTGKIPAHYFLPVLTLGLCDPAAALAGNFFSKGQFKIGCETKSLSGSLAFFVIAFFLYLFIAPGYAVYPAAVFALLTAVAEAVSTKGIDNISIPLAAIGAIYLLP